MTVTRSDLLRFAAASGFQPDALEKVLRLLLVVEGQGEAEQFPRIFTTLLGLHLVPEFFHKSLQLRRFQKHLRP